MSEWENDKVYRTIAKGYDVFDMIFRMGGRGSPRAGLLTVIDDRPQRLLDVCVGTASSAMLVAANRQQSQVVGIDISEDMLAVARQKIDESQLTNIQVMKMSASSLQFEDGSFDIAMVSFALHEFEPALRVKTLKEMTRVLKPGGKLCVIDFARQKGLRNRIFITLWKLIEPSCFGGFINLEWHQELASMGMRYESEREYSFSNLWVFGKVKL